MSFFDQIASFLSVQIETPPSFGWFHLLFVGIVVLGTVILCITAKNCSDKKFRIIALMAWLVMVVFEIIKQIVFSYQGPGQWDYQWYAFPFQLCSMPLYVLPFIFLMKDNKVRDAFVAFMATFSFFGGLVVFIYPNDVFIEYLLVDLQTMIHHGLQIVLGIFFMVYYRKRLSFKFFAKGILVFLALAIVAMGINLLAPTFTSETVNMFYISPYFPCTLVILDGIYASVPYIVFLLIYLLGFILAGLLMFLIMWGIITLVKKAKNKKQVAS